MNSTSQLLEIPAGTMTGTFTSLDQTHLSEEENKQVGAEKRFQGIWRGGVLNTWGATFKQACKECATREQEGQLADMLTILKRCRHAMYSIFVNSAHHVWKYCCET